MNTEIRKVPKNWSHPYDGSRREYLPLYCEYYLDAFNEWLSKHYLWMAGKHPEQLPVNYHKDIKFFAEWGGDPPEVKHYVTESWENVTEWEYQVYETDTEGTPISIRFAEKAEADRWRMENYPPIIDLRK